jgi:integral membrane protein (TIGR01906 family)
MLSLFANALIFDAQTQSALLEPDAIPATMQVLAFFRGEGGLPQVFDEKESAHLRDVKRVVNGVSYASFALLVIFLFLLGDADVSKVFGRGFGIVLIIVGVLALVPFDAFFARFHELFFAEDTWVFAKESVLIQLYPFAYFQAFFGHIVALAAVFSAALASISLVQNNNV